MKIEFSARHGLVSVYPPPGRKMLDLVFYTNTSLKLLSEGGSVMPCPEQRACMQNQTRITIGASLRELQRMLRQRFVRYIANKDYFGRDELKVWVSDQGFTDRSYADELSVTVFIPIIVLPVNDAPTISATPEVLKYDQGQICHVDFILQRRDPIPGLRCRSLSDSRVPPANMEYSDAILFEDVDVRDRAWGNITVTIKVQAANGGRLFFNATHPRVVFLQRIDEDDMSVMSLQGSIDHINSIMPYLRWDADLSYTGYAPLLITIMDHENSGGPHCHDLQGGRVCRDMTFTCPAAPCPASDVVSKPDLCIDNRGGAGRACMEWLALPNMPHELYPNSNRMTTLTVDLSVGAEAECQLPEDTNESSRCDLCKAHPDGCNWCPTTCGGVGKCMKGMARPTHDTCPTVSGNASAYGQCLGASSTAQDPLPVILIAAGAGGLFLLAAFLFSRWARRRHGGMRAYKRKKLTDAKRFATAMRIMPPDSARWAECFAVLLVLTTLALLLAGFISQNGSDVQVADVYLDEATVVTLTVDFCSVRFIPARNYPSPTSLLTVPKIRSYLVKDEKVQLQTEACSNHVRMTVVNTRDTSVKYLNYRCDFEVIVPEGVVLPGITIVENNASQPSTVRGGPVDPDTQDFGLRFGPNQLRLQAGYMQVRLSNVTAKEMHFDIDNGYVLGRDIATTDPTRMSTFKTKAADIILTTNRMTSVQVQQDSGNLVCLTAANNSLFVDSRSQKECKYVDSNAFSRRGPAGGGVGAAKSTLSQVPGMPQYHSRGQQIPNREARRALAAEALAAVQHRRSHTNWTIPEFGPTEMCPDGKTFKKDVPFVPECTDMTFCRQSDTEQCLCRPICDMVEPEQLCYDGVCGVQGVCDVTGKCCRMILRDFSTADLFPAANQPRDGAAVDPVLYPWQPLQLEQRWQLRSVSGQVAVTALQDIDADASVSSFKLGAPSSGVLDHAISIPTRTKDVIDALFHPSGQPKPNQAIMEFSLAGPGMPERQEGSVLWLSSLVYLVLSAPILDTFSLGIVKPARSTIEVGFSPSFCPAFIPKGGAWASEPDRRLIEVRAKIQEALQEHPPEQARKPLPLGSALVYQPTSGKPKGFRLDPKTNKIVVDLIDLGSFTAIWWVLYSTLALGGAVALGVVVVIAQRLRAHLGHFRSQRFVDENVFANIQWMMQQQKAALAAQRHAGPGDDAKLAAAADGFELGAFATLRDTEEGKRSWDELIARTDLIFVFEDMLADPETAASSTLRLMMVVQALGLLLAPLAVIWFFASNWRAAVLDETCRLRADLEACLQGRERVSTTVDIGITVALVVFALELAAHYLQLSYHGVRPYLRRLFYAVYAGACFLVLVIVTCVLLWILLGVLLLPSKVLPYAAGVAGLLANAATVWAKLRCFEYKVRRAVAQRIDGMRPLLRKVPKPLLDTIMRQKLEVVLKAEGLSAPLIAAAVARQLVLLLLLYVFAFVAFAAFTDPYDLVSGVFNACIVAVMAVAFNNQKRSDSNSKEARELVFETQERLSNAIFLHLRHVHFQTQAALTLYARMRAQLRANLDSDDGSSAMSESASFLSTQYSSEEEFAVPPRAESPEAEEDMAAAEPIARRLEQLKAQQWQEQCEAED